MTSLMEKYNKEVKDKLAEDLSIANKMALPKLEKIVVNMGVGDLVKDKNQMEKVSADLAIITGQKPKVTVARVSVAGFNIRVGQPVGLAVTLRGKRMYDFLQRLIVTTLPRLRDFRGVPLKSFDKSGNYTLGIVEHTVFPEIDITKVNKPRGLEITIVTNTRDLKKSRKLLELLGMPFEKKN